MLSFEKFSKSYHGRLIISIEKLDLAHGVHWIKGHNGSGKSTLFKSVSGLIPFDGKITFDNTDLKREPVAFRKQVNFSEAEPLYPGFLTSKDLVRFVGKAKGASKGNQDEIVKHFGVIDFFEQPCETYSSGMLKKLSLALAFLGQPKLIILDEPFITLDEKSRDNLSNTIVEFKKKGVMFLMSSHHDLESGLIPETTFRIESNTLVHV